MVICRFVETVIRYTNSPKNKNKEEEEARMIRKRNLKS